MSNFDAMRARLPKSAAFAVMLLGIAAPGTAVELELGVIGGLQQTGSLGSRQGTIDLEAGPLYGVVVGWRVQADGLLEVAWTRQETEATGDLTTGPLRIDAVVDTLELGGLWESQLDTVRPFLGVSAGGTRLAADGEGFGEGWNASGAISGGVRYFLGDHAVVRLEARATGIYFSDGGALGCVFPSGVCGVSASGSLLGAFSGRIVLSARF